MHITPSLLTQQNEGLDLKAEVKVFQFGGSLKDALIIKYKITNESSKDINKLYFGFQGDPHIGGSSDYGDDRAHVYFNKNISDPNSFANNTIYMWDADGVGAFRKTGLLVILGFRFLDTPRNIGLSSLHIAPYTNSLPNVPKNSELMWQWLSGTIDSSSELYSQAGDNIINFGTGAFSLNSGETKYVTLAIFLAHDYAGMLKNSVYLYWNHYWPDISSDTSASGGTNTYKISSPVIPTYDGISGKVNITWDYSGSDVNAKTIIEYSSDFGKNWNILTSDVDASANTFVWNTENYRDGVNYLLRLIAYNPSDKRQYYYSVGHRRFTINNSVNAQPELQLYSQLKDTTITQKFINLSWLMEDADNSNLTTQIGYSFDKKGPYTSIYDSTTLTGNNFYNWNISQMPNSSSYYIKVTVDDGNTDTTLITGPFAINYWQTNDAANNMLHVHGYATPKFNVQITDSSKITTDTYEITFNDDNSSAKTFSIKDVVNNKDFITNYPLTDSTSTPEFDGIKLTILDSPNNIDTNKTTFNDPVLNHTVSFMYPPEIGQRIALPSDWEIIWNNLDTTYDGNWLYPGDTVINHIGKPTITPFRIYDITNNQFVHATYLIFERYISTRNQIWNWNEAIVLRPTNATDATTTYELKFDFSQGPLPGEGDTLYIITHKTITSNDVFRFAIGNNKVVVSANDKNIPTKYQLSQNYPNPFNPTTTINYQLEKTGFVSLKVYNVLGQEVTSLINEVKSPGKYNVVFNASNLASGVYIYRLTINNFVAVKKMELIK